MLVLGVDPGLASMGYGLVESNNDGLRSVAHGALTTLSRLPAQERLHHLYWELMDIVARHRPTEMAVEELFASTKLRTAVQVSQARGIALLVAANQGLAVFEYTPSQVEQAVTGYGRGRKAQVTEMVRLQLSLASPPRPDDAADALAVAICHIRLAGLMQMVADP